MAGTKRKRSTQSGRKGGPKRQRTRMGFSSVARTRGGAVVGEMKYFDVVKSAGVIPASTDWTGTEFDPTTYNTLCVPTVGSAVDQRIGKSIKIMKIKMKVHIQCNSQTTQTLQDNPSVIRIVLHQDKQTNATQAQGEDVMATTGSAGLNPLTFQNINNFGRFRVLKDKLLVMGPATALYDTGVPTIKQTGVAKTFKWNIKFKKPVVVRFNATNGGSVADIVDNSFHVIASANSVELAPSISYCCRTCYKE